MDVTFTPTKWDTAQDKARFVTQFQRFVESDFARSKFPKWFYEQLSNTFGHIAHYDIHGFYATFFEDRQGKVDFIAQCLEYPCYGDSAWTYSDAEKVIQDWLKSRDVLLILQQRLDTERETIERQTYLRLKARFEPV